MPADFPRAERSGRALQHSRAMPTTRTVTLVPSLGAIALAGACALAGLASVAVSPARAQQPSAASLSTRGNAVIRDSVRRVLDRALADSAFPGAIAVVGTRTRVIAQYAVAQSQAAGQDWIAF